MDGSVPIDDGGKNKFDDVGDDDSFDSEENDDDDNYDQTHR